jgi:serine/threonine-protein kinase RsbW
MSQRQTFDHDTRSASRARRFVGQAIQEASPEVTQAVLLMASELASNCIRHTNSRFEVAVVKTAGAIRVEATDRGSGEPVLRHPDPTDPSGRGLEIVEMLSADWGFELLPEKGKTVWFTVAVPVGDRVDMRCAVAPAAATV